MSNQRPDNWEEMGAIARHQWSVQQLKPVEKPKKESATKPVEASKEINPERPENWEDMGAIERHQWSTKHLTLVERAKNTAQQAKDKNPLHEQYFYWSTLIKSDEQSLKSIPDHAERDKRKPALLNKYREYLTEYMAAKETHDNNVLFYCLVWACDCEQWDWAIELCDYATKTKQTNTVFRRGHEDVCSDAVLVIAYLLFKTAEKLPDCFMTVFDRMTTKAWTIDNITQSKFYKLMGDALDSTEPNKALSYFKAAHELNETIGVKGRINRLTDLLSH